MPLNAALSSQRLASLRGVSQLPAAHVDALTRLLEDPDDWRCFRINPLAFASEHAMSSGEAIDLFLHASRAGLTELRFNLVCPGCGAVEYQVARMDAVPSGAWYCTVCHRDVEANLDDRVEVSFTPELGVRVLELQPFASVEHYWRMFFSANFQRSEELQAFLKAKTLGLWLVRPGAHTEFTFEARPGTAYRLLSVDTHSEVMLQHTRASASSGVPRVEVSASEAGLSPRELTITEGPVTVQVANRGKVPVGLMGTEVDWEGLVEVLERAPSRMRPFLTAKMLLNTQTFRDLFRVQTLDADLRLRLRSLTLLFTDLKGSTELYDRTGDLRAYAFVREHFKILSDAVKRNRGAIIKTMGDAIMASFNEPTDAAKAAVQMMAGMDALNASLKAEGHDTGLKVGLHEGPALAVTSEERLDYFGQTVNVAARVQGLAAAGEIWATLPVMEAPGVKSVLRDGGFSGEAQDVSLKGVGGKTRVHRLHR